MKPKRLPEKEFKYIYSKVPRLCVEVIIQTKKGVILSKRDIPPYKGWWHIPGGTVMFGETLEEAVKRIALDELGLNVEIKKMLGVIEYPKLEGNHAVGVAFSNKIISGNLSGSYQAKEVETFMDIPKKTIPEQKEFLTANLKLKS